MIGSKDYVSVPLEDVGDNQDRDETDEMEVTFCQVAKPKRTMKVSSQLTIRQLKEMAFEDEVAAHKRIRFINSGKVLEDSKILADTGLKYSTFIHVAVTDALPEAVLAVRIEYHIVHHGGFADSKILI